MAWVIDPAHTRIEFSIKHMMIATVRGYFGKFGGTVKVDPNDLTKSSVQGYVDMATISTNEPNRDAHLRSADFFDVEHYPQMTFTSTSIKNLGSDRWQVAGDLTIKDQTRQVVWDVSNEGRGKDPWGNEHWGLSAQTSFNRKDFDLTWTVALETGGWLVGDQVKVTADVELIYGPDTPAEEAQKEAKAAEGA